jgi:hypothetical protein
MKDGEEKKYVWGMISSIMIIDSVQEDRVTFELMWLLEYIYFEGIWLLNI